MNASPKTELLVDRLVAELRPVRPLSPVWVRLGGFVGFAALVLVALALLRGVRLDLGERLGSVAFGLGVAGGLLTGVCGALAALLLAAPERSRWWIALPLPALGLGLGAVGVGCFSVWVPILPGVVTPQEVANCFATVVLAGTPLSVGLVWLLRRAMPLRPALPTLAAGLAASGMTAAALSLLHSIDPSFMILLWNFGIIALVTAGQALVARRVVAV